MLASEEEMISSPCKDLHVPRGTGFRAVAAHHRSTWNLKPARLFHVKHIPQGLQAPQGIATISSTRVSVFHVKHLAPPRGLC
jgi:hypothetical protein